jgi:hypothetical protein
MNTAPHTGFNKLYATYTFKVKAGNIVRSCARHGRKKCWDDTQFQVILAYSVLTCNCCVPKRREMFEIH